MTKFEEVLGWVNGWVEGTVFADGTGTSIALVLILCLLLGFPEYSQKKIKAKTLSKLNVKTLEVGTFNDIGFFCIFPIALKLMIDLVHKKFFTHH